MGRRRGKHATLEERLEHRHRERRALIRVGARADLIEKREVAALRLGKRCDDVPKMRGERRKRLRDRLLVADVGEDAADHWHAPAVRGNGETARCHRGQQADRLERHSLAPGIRTGDDENAELTAEAHVDADDGALLHEERVARVDEIEHAVGVELGPGRLQRIGIEGFREDEVEGGERHRHRVKVFARLLDAS